jgi:hypothetical protein
VTNAAIRMGKVRMGKLRELSGVNLRMFCGGAMAQFGGSFRYPAVRQKRL